MRLNEMKTILQKKKGKGLPYVYRYKAYLGKRQKGSSLLSNVLAKLLLGVGNIVGV